MAELTFRVRASTMGRDFSGYAGLSGGYRYHKRPGWPYDPASRDPDQRLPAGATKAKADKEKRMIVFTAAREKEGLGVEEAARKAGVASRTAGRYEDERLERRLPPEGEGLSPREIAAGLHAEIAAWSPEHARLVAAFTSIPRREDDETAWIRQFRDFADVTP